MSPYQGGCLCTRHKWITYLKRCPSSRHRHEQEHLGHPSRQLAGVYEQEACFKRFHMTRSYTASQYKWGKLGFDPSRPTPPSNRPDESNQRPLELEWTFDQGSLKLSIALFEVVGLRWVWGCEVGMAVWGQARGANHSLSSVTSDA